MTESTERYRAILSVLRGVYGKGTMVDACAKHIDSKWDEWRQGYGRTRHGESMEEAVHMEVWNWFAGGGAAEVAGARVVAAVDALTVEGERARIAEQFELFKRRMARADNEIRAFSAEGSE
jgi:hypothetical protein